MNDVTTIIWMMLAILYASEYPPTSSMLRSWLSMCRSLSVRTMVTTLESARGMP